MLQDFYRAVPVLLAPVLGNPLALASYGIDPNASIPDKVQADSEHADTALHWLAAGNCSVAAGPCTVPVHAATMSTSLSQAS